MAYSAHWHYPDVMRLLKEWQPRSIVDVGCGVGVYGLLSRLNLTWGKDPKSLRVIGIEAWSGFPRGIWQDWYDMVALGEAKEELPRFLPVACVLFCDVLEHMDKAEAIELLRMAEGGAEHVIISAPTGMMRQGEVAGNPWEKHLSSWHASEFDLRDDRMEGAQDFVPAQPWQTKEYVDERPMTFLAWR